MPYTAQGTGFRPTDTSLDAALSIEPRAPNLRAEVLGWLEQQIRPASTEDIAAALDRPYGSIQPRLSELRDLGLVEDSGSRGLTKYGKTCILWRAKRPVTDAKQGEPTNV